MLVEKPIRDFKMLLDTDDTGMSTDLMKNGSWEGTAPDVMAKLVQPNWTVIEMGACIGFYAMIEAKRGANVYVIEPVPRNIEIIRKNIELNGFDNARAFELAIGAENGWAKFQLSPTRSDRGRFTATKSGDGVIEVETITLDSFVAREGIDKVDLLRADIEGAEVGLVTGGQNTLGAMKKGSWIFMDIHPVKVPDPLINLLPALQSILDHGFIPKKVLAPGAYQNLPPKGFAKAICQLKGFPKVFFEKVK